MDGGVSERVESGGMDVVSEIASLFLSVDKSASRLASYMINAHPPNSIHPSTPLPLTLRTQALNSISINQLERAQHIRDRFSIISYTPFLLRVALLSRDNASQIFPRRRVTWTWDASQFGAVEEV